MPSPPRMKHWSRLVYTQKKHPKTSTKPWMIYTKITSNWCWMQTVQFWQSKTPPNWDKAPRCKYDLRCYKSPHIYCEQQIAAAKQTNVTWANALMQPAPNTDQCTSPKTDIDPDFLEKLFSFWYGPISGAMFSMFNFGCVSNIGNCFTFALILAACPTLWRPTRWRVKTLCSTKCLVFCMVNPMITQRKGFLAICLGGSSVCLSEVSGTVIYIIYSQRSYIFSRHLWWTKIGNSSFALVKGTEIQKPTKGPLL